MSEWVGEVSAGGWIVGGWVGGWLFEVRLGWWVSERVEVGWKLWVNRWINGWWVSRVYGG